MAKKQIKTVQTPQQLMNAEFIKLTRKSLLFTIRTKPDGKWRQVKWSQIIQDTIDAGDQIFEGGGRYSIKFLGIYTWIEIYQKNQDHTLISIYNPKGSQAVRMIRKQPLSRASRPWRPTTLFNEPFRTFLRTADVTVNVKVTNVSVFGMWSPFPYYAGVTGNDNATNVDLRNAIQGFNQRNEGIHLGNIIHRDAFINKKVKIQIEIVTLLQQTKELYNETVKQMAHWDMIGAGNDAMWETPLCEDVMGHINSFL